jgi:methionine-rich copper-binding protein CopC
MDDTGVSAATTAGTDLSGAMASASPASWGSAPHLIAAAPSSGAASVTLTFDRDVLVAAQAAEVTGLATGSHPDYTAAYDATTHTLTLAWATALPADRYTVRLVAAFVTGADDGVALDGEVGDPAAATLPSGDGMPGGDAWLEFEVR